MLKILIFICLLLFVLCNINEKQIENFYPSSLKITSITYYPCLNCTTPDIKQTTFNTLKQQYINNISFNTSNSVNDGKLEFKTNILTYGNISLIYTGEYDFNNVNNFLKDHRVSDMAINVEFNNGMGENTVNSYAELAARLNRRGYIIKFNKIETNTDRVKVYIYLNNSAYLLYTATDQTIFRNDIYNLVDIIDKFISTIL